MNKKTIAILIGMMCLTAPSLYAQKIVKRLVQTTSADAGLKKIPLKIEPIVLRAQIQQFIYKNDRWPHAFQSPAEEMLLAKQVNRFIVRHENTVEANDLALSLKQLRQDIQQVEYERDLYGQLLAFIAEHKSWPRRDIRAVTGALNRVEDMSAEQIAEFKLARQIEYILEKDPSSDLGQKIRALKKTWDK